jgi:hypothetical protein
VFMKWWQQQVSEEEEGSVMSSGGNCYDFSFLSNHDLSSVLFICSSGLVIADSIFSAC